MINSLKLSFLLLLVGADIAYSADIPDYLQAVQNTQQRFIKIDNSGAVLADNAPTWSCIYDNQTQLLWEEKTDDGGLRDKDWQYTWYDLRTDYNQGVEGFSDRHHFQNQRKLGETCGSTLEQCNTEQYLTMIVKSGGLCGQTEWRLPEITELKTLIMDNTFEHPWAKSPKNTMFGLWTKLLPSRVYLDSRYFQQLPQKLWYWSVNTNMNDKNQADIVYFDAGINYGAPKSNNLYLRLVYKKAESPKLSR